MIDTVFNDYSGIPDEEFESYLSAKDIAKRFKLGTTTVSKIAGKCKMPTKRDVDNKNKVLYRVKDFKRFLKDNPMYGVKNGRRRKTL